MYVAPALPEGVVGAIVPSTICSKSSWHTAYQPTPPELLRSQKLLDSVQPEENTLAHSFHLCVPLKAHERFTKSKEGDDPPEGTGR